MFPMSSQPITSILMDSKKITKTKSAKIEGLGVGVPMVEALIMKSAKIAGQGVGVLIVEAPMTVQAVGHEANPLKRAIFQMLKTCLWKSNFPYPMPLNLAESYLKSKMILHLKTEVIL